MSSCATSLNRDWKLPVAYFLLSDNFSGKSRSDLIRQCIYKLNITGAIVTNIVMDNCPVNYATFRFLGCQLKREYDQLDTSTDMVNNLEEYIVALFDPPHLSKLGISFNQINSIFTQPHLTRGGGH